MTCEGPINDCPALGAAITYGGSGVGGINICALWLLEAFFDERLYKTEKMLRQNP